MWVFTPILRPMIWGGGKIASYKGIMSPCGDIGESWDLSGVDGAESRVAGGPDNGVSLSGLISRYGPSLLGEKNYNKFGDRFPLLIKFIDAGSDLSVQVHPTDDQARSLGGRFGKAEMWYVVGADKDARVANGLNRMVTPSDCAALVEGGGILDVLNYIAIKPGDAFYVPPGRIHTIGKGSFIVEIQQASDITYRLYDYNRKDSCGKERELHVEEALEAVNFEDAGGGAIEYVARRDLPVNLVTSSFFTVNLWQIDHEVMRDYSEWDTFVAITCTGGRASISSGAVSMTIGRGDTLLIPASCPSVTIYPDGVFEALETYIK